MKKPRPVLNKRDFIERYIAREFGNRSKTWGTIDEFNLLKSTGKLNLNPDGLVCIRNRNAGSPFMVANLKQEDVDSVINKWLESKTFKIGDAYIAESPMPMQIFQGEFLFTTKGPYLFAEIGSRLPMRQGLETNGKEYTGTTALLLLKHFLDDPSYDNLMQLSEDYPDHTIEFSVFPMKCGIYHRNTCFWEVRRY